MSEVSVFEQWNRRYKIGSKNLMKKFGFLSDKYLQLDEVDVNVFGKMPRDLKCIYNKNCYRNKVIVGERENATLIGEAQIMTYPAKKLREKVMQELKKSLEPWQLECEIEVDDKRENLISYYYDETDYTSDDLETRKAGNVQVVIPIRDIQFSGKTKQEICNELVSKVIKPFKFFGYDVANADFIDVPSDAYFQGKMLSWIQMAVLHFEAKFIDAPPQKPGEFLYHVTPSDRVGRIKKRGILPRSESTKFSYGDRVYLFDTDDLRVMLRYIIESGKSNASWSILQINPAKIPSLKLYADNNFEKVDGKAVAAFTYNTIPPAAIVGCQNADKLLDIMKRKMQA